MIYEIIGKIVVTIIIMFGIALLWCILLLAGSFLMDWIETLPQWIKTVIAIIFIVLFILFVGNIIFVIL